MRFPKFLTKDKKPRGPDTLVMYSAAIATTVLVKCPHNLKRDTLESVFAKLQTGFAAQANPDTKITATGDYSASGRPGKWMSITNKVEELELVQKVYIALHGDHAVMIFCTCLPYDMKRYEEAFDHSAQSVRAE